MFGIKKKKLTINEYAKKYNDSKKKIEKILINIGYIKKQERWTLVTNLGKLLGIEEKYNPKSKSKFIIIPDGIHKGKDFKTEYYRLEETENKKQKTKNKMTNTEKKEKGDEYEKYIADFFRKQDYYVWEHGKEKGVKDSSIDLIIKKDKHIFFVQCKNWEKWKINHKEVKATRTDVREYLKKEKNLWNLIKDYESKILYITPKECLAKSAYTYIKENSDIVEYKVIPII